MAYCIMLRSGGRGVAEGWIGVDISTPLVPEDVQKIDTDPASSEQ